MRSAGKRNSEGVAGHDLEDRPRLLAFKLIFIEIAGDLIRLGVEFVEHPFLGSIEQVEAHGPEAALIAKADGKHIVADAEGLALAPEGEKDGYLIVSSQGDNAYTLFRLTDHSYAGRFRIAAGAVGATDETDGIELAAGDFGPAYPGGIFVAQDGFNPGTAQNFKMVAWDDIRRALGWTARDAGGE